VDYVVRREAAQAAGLLTGEALRLAVEVVYLTQGALELLDPLAKSFRGRFLESLGCHVRSLKGPQEGYTGNPIQHFISFSMKYNL
jgi:hypothetical protein